MEYRVYMTIYNSFDVEAESEEEASQKVRELGVFETLKGANYEIDEIDLIEEENESKQTY